MRAGYIVKYSSFQDETTLYLKKICDAIFDEIVKETTMAREGIENF